MVKVVAIAEGGGVRVCREGGAGGGKSGSGVLVVVDIAVFVSGVVDDDLRNAHVNAESNRSDEMCGCPNRRELHPPSKSGGIIYSRSGVKKVVPIFVNVIGIEYGDIGAVGARQLDSVIVVVIAACVEFGNKLAGQKEGVDVLPFVSHIKIGAVGFAG